ncbi:MAG: DEAD/DEAH box helicase [Acidimicrobiia bacterium]|nr:DEAD/DEAH box helicase [Acidimicrobiia bacterium]
MAESLPFSAATNAWFDAVFEGPTPAQSLGWEAVASGEHTLIHAPTGSGKTLAAFLWALDGLLTRPEPPPRSACRVLYVSPLKALAYDVDRNLRAPLTGIRAAASQLELDTQPVSVAMRTGDTPQRDRQAMVRTPPDLLITTPESLYLMLTSQAREILASVETVIIDEIHALAGTKRGAHLALSLERLDALAGRSVQRIGLSATQRPLDLIAEFLGGGNATEEAWEARPVQIVDAPREKELDIEIVVPVRDMTRPEADIEDLDEAAHRSIWPAMYPRLLDLVLEHRSTILFVNSRSLAERLANELNRLADDEIVQAHHGSVSREQRIDIEDRLKRGLLRGVVATSTLELGIDMAAVDLVVLVESPTSVARGLQRVGRAGHQVGAPSVAKVFPKHRGDLLETAVVVERMYEGAIEETSVPQNPIDVLAQQLVAMVAGQDLDVDDTYRLVRSAMPYRNLTRQTFESILDMLSGRYPSDDFAELRPRIVWNRASGTLSARSNARLLAVTNPGTIPDRGLYTVNLPDGARVGELDEEMVYESRPGDTFVLGSTTWRIDDISPDRVTVTPAPGAPAARMPFWHGDAPGRPVELGRAVGAFTRRIGRLERDEAIRTLTEQYRLDSLAAANLATFVGDEVAATGTLPTDRTIVVERFRDEIGDWRIVVLSPFGGRVHAPWALAIRNRYRSDTGGSVDVVWSDDGIVLRFPDVDSPPDPAMVLLDPTTVEETVIEEVGDSALFTSRFREAAARALLLPKRRPGTRTPLWLQRRKAANLLEVTREFGSFPVMLETYREVLQDHFDVPSLVQLLSDIDQRTTRIVDVDTEGPSPFASSLMFDFIASFMYEYDAPVAERRAAALTLDRSLLADLLGEPEFRDLLDADVIDSVEADLQHLSEDRRAGSLDGTHDLLRDLGPLTEREIRVRLRDGHRAEPWLDELVASGRAYRHTLQGETVYVAVEDLARLRDAIGIQPAPGVPSAFLEPVDDPLGDVISRYARTHGPFTVDDASSATHVPPAVVVEVLHRLERDGKIRAGAYRPGGSEHEWVSAEVLRRLRRRSLSVLRQQVEAVEPAAYARFLPVWQETGSERPRPALEIVHQLAGAPIVASTLDDQVMATRSTRESADLDAVLATGEVVWVGLSALGSRDGRIALAPRSIAPAVVAEARPFEAMDDRHRAILDHLSASGASFFTDVYHALGGGDPDEAADAIWDLVWTGAVTNDSLAPLRAYTSRRSRKRSKRPQLMATPHHATGRWYLTATLHQASGTNEERALALASVLLDRYGVVTRDVVLAEGIPGGFSGLYPAFSSLEDVGTVRRGYFVEGMGGAQFALPGAIERLRTLDASSPVVLAATDPANPYGAAVPWPESAGSPERRAGALVVVAGQGPLAWLDPPGRKLATFGAPTEATVAAIEQLTLAHGKATVATIDGIDTREHPLSAELLARGFVSGYKGFTVRSAPASRQRRERV